MRTEDLRTRSYMLGRRLDDPLMGPPPTSPDSGQWTQARVNVSSTIWTQTRLSPQLRTVFRLTMNTLTTELHGHRRTDVGKFPCRARESLSRRHTSNPFLRSFLQRVSGLPPPNRKEWCCRSIPISAQSNRPQHEVSATDQPALGAQHRPQIACPRGTVPA